MTTTLIERTTKGAPRPTSDVTEFHDSTCFMVAMSTSELMKTHKENGQNRTVVDKHHKVGGNVYAKLNELNVFNRGHTTICSCIEWTWLDKANATFVGAEGASLHRDKAGYVVYEDPKGGRGSALMLRGIGSLADSNGDTVVCNPTGLHGPSGTHVARYFIEKGGFVRNKDKHGMLKLTMPLIRHPKS